MNIYSDCDTETDEIIEELASIKGEDLFSIAIRKSIAERKPHDQILTWIKSQAQDNPRVMEEIIGIELTNKILAL